MSGVLQELLKEENVSNSLNAVEIEAEDFEDVSVKYGVESVPTFVFIKVIFSAILLFIIIIIK